jgi:hypothetical protein
MTNHLYMQDFDCFPFFLNVVKSKLMEAQHHLKKCEVYRMHPELINAYQLDYIIITHEDTHEFLATVYQQCSVWRKQSTLIGHIAKIKYLEDIAKKLETTIDHIFYVVENIQHKKNSILSGANDMEVSEVVTRH